MLQATLANLQRSRRQRPYEAKQFEPKWGRAVERKGPMTGDDMLRAVKGLNKQMGGTVQNVDAS